MNNYQKTFIVLSIICFLIAGIASCEIRNINAQSELLCELPTVEFIAEYTENTTYNLSANFDGFIVKYWDNGLHVDYFKQNSFTLTNSMNGLGGHKARIWQVKNPQLPIEFVVNGSFALGTIEDSTEVSTVLIDNDTFVTRIENDEGNILTTEQPSFVQYISFTTTHTGDYSVETDGSIGIAGVCENPVWDKSSVVLTGYCGESSDIVFELLNHGSSMTGTIPYVFSQNGKVLDNGFVQLEENQTLYFHYNLADYPFEILSFSVEQRPNHPGNSRPSVSISTNNCAEIPTETSTPVITETETPVPTVTETPTATFTETPVSTVTSTATETSTSTSTATPTIVVTSTPTSTDVPTNLYPEPEPTVSIALTPSLEPVYNIIFVPFISSQYNVYVGEGPVSLP